MEKGSRTSFKVILWLPVHSTRSFSNFKVLLSSVDILEVKLKEDRQDKFFI